MARRYDIQNLEPKPVMAWFKKISAIPHGSFDEAALANMLKHELNKAGCSVKQFSSGAILARKKATKGYENRSTILLQAHMDMVLAKTADLNVNLKTTPVKPFYDTNDGYLKCDRTTLGADDGLGVAMIMEIMTSNKYEHGPLEAFLSVTEEVDVQYCMSTVPPKSFKAKHLLNLDVDAPDKMYTSSNGGTKVTCDRVMNLKPVKPNTKTYKVSLSHLHGGHSGSMIHNPLNNAIKLICESLYSFTQDHSKIRLVSIDGGTAINAIPRRVDVIIQIDPKDAPELKKHVKHSLDIGIELAQGLDTEAKLSITPLAKSAKKACSYDETEQILYFYSYIQTGIDRMDITMKHIFSTNNVGLVRTENNIIKTQMMPRCFSKDALLSHFDKLRYFGNPLGFKNFQQNVSCLPWLSGNSEKIEIVKAWSDAYTKVTGKYTIPAKHPAGIESAAIIANSPQLNNHAVSTGPRLYDCHTPNERAELKSIQDWWETTLLTIKGIK